MIATFDGFEINSVHNGDAWKICDFSIANSERLKRYFPKTLEQNLNPTLSQLFVDQKIKNFEEKSEFLYTLKETETRKLGGLIYLKELDWDKKQGEFAYAIDYNFKGKSLISKSIQKLSKYAFEDLGLEVLQIITHKTNSSSITVAENNSFKWIKTLKKEFTPTSGTSLNMELYELYS